VAWDTSIIFVLLGLCYIFFSEAHKLDNAEGDTHKWIKILMYFLGWGCMLLLIMFGRLIVEFLEPTALKVIHMLDITYMVMVYLTGGIIAYWFLYFSYQLYKQKLSLKKRDFSNLGNYGGRNV